MTTVRTELSQLRGLAVDAGFGAGWSAVRSLPEPLARRAFQLGADLAVKRDGAGVQQLRANLRRVIGPGPQQFARPVLDEVVATAMRRYARYWLETFRLPKMDHRAIAAAVERNTTGAHFIDQARAAGKGYILALPHMGNWDVAGIWLIDRYHEPFTTVAERLQPESLFDRFVEYRQGLGMEVLALTGSARSAASVLTERLQAGHGICLVADRDLSQQGIDVQFFGEAARMPAGPAMLAATTGATLIPVGTWFTDDGWGLRMCPPIELTGTRLGDRVRTATQVLADRFAEMISEHPTDWHMLQRLWLADAKSDAKSAAKSAAKSGTKAAG